MGLGLIERVIMREEPTDHQTQLMKAAMENKRKTEKKKLKISKNFLKTQETCSRLNVRVYDHEKSLQNHFK